MPARGARLRQRLAVLARVLLPILIWYVNYVPLHLAAHTHIDSLDLISVTGHADGHGNAEHPEAPGEDEDHEPHPAQDHLCGYLTLLVAADALVLHLDQCQIFPPESEGVVLAPAITKSGRGPPASSTNIA